MPYIAIESEYNIIKSTKDEKGEKKQKTERATIYYNLSLLNF